MKRTPLYDSHVEAGGKMVDFSGWELPIHYGSQIEEHHAVRRSAGMFDVSHMTQVDIAGPGARPFLERLLANDVGRLTDRGKALYGCMLNEKGGVIDDLICYYLDDEHYVLVVNAATRDKDLDWMQAVIAGFDAEMTEQCRAMLAVQGPEARGALCSTLGSLEADQAMALGPFSAAWIGGLFVARTGYTGEDGFEVMVDAADAESTWAALLAAGVAPCGLGARDTLRLEAGMNLYGQDMDETVTPLESALAWTIAWTDGRDFIGREALERQRDDGPERKLVGLIMEQRAVMRPGQTVHTTDGDGVVTSGSYSPTLSRPIAFARIPAGAGETVEVDVRGKRLEARVVRPPFVRRGKACEGIL